MTRRKRDDLSPVALKKRIGDQQQSTNLQFGKSCEGNINFFPIAGVQNADLSTSAELAAFLQSEIDKWGPVIRDAQIKVEN